MSYFWHRPMIPAAIKKGGMRWHVYDGNNGQTLCGNFGLIGFGRPETARERMPSSRAQADICKACERKRPKQSLFSATRRVAK